MELNAIVCAENKKLIHVEINSHFVILPFRQVSLSHLASPVRKQQNQLF